MLPKSVKGSLRESESVRGPFTDSRARWTAGISPAPPKSVKGTLRESKSVRVPLTDSQVANHEGSALPARQPGAEEAVKGSLRESDSLKEPFTARRPEARIERPNLSR
ncbi:hypothetical protein GCM10009565_30960 [Amycolatopsis albidoflavus]